MVGMKTDLEKYFEIMDPSVVTRVETVIAGLEGLRRPLSG
jgi:hypothetical protein